MKPQQLIPIIFVVAAFSLSGFAQDAVQWKNYIDSSNEIWFQAPASVVIDREGERQSITLHTFFDGIKISVRKQELEKDPIKYVRDLDLALFGEKGSKYQNYKSPASYVRQEIAPIGDHLTVTLHVGTKRSYFVVSITGSQENNGIKDFLATIRIGGSRLFADSAVQDMTANDEQIVFDKLPNSPETESALKKETRPEPAAKFGEVKVRLPLDLDKLSADVIVLRKPKPSYTDEARMNQVQGTIYANIEFLGNGDIGTITVDKRAHRGLARNVISAARKIKFIPAKANGKPIDVTRTLPYRFTIY